MVLEDVGLTWVRDQGVLSEADVVVREGSVTVRILGVIADGHRTTLLYHITGLPMEPAPLWLHPRIDGGWHHWPVPEVAVSVEVDERPAPILISERKRTRAGFFGFVSTVPLSKPRGDLQVIVDIGDRRQEVEIAVEQTRRNGFSRSQTINQGLEINGARVTVLEVIRTPLETVVRYRVDPTFWMMWPAVREQAEEVYIIRAGQEIAPVDMAGWLQDRHVAFPPGDGPFRLVVEALTIGVEADLEWRLEEGAVAEARGVPFTLSNVGRDGGQLSFQLSYPAVEEFRGFGAGYLVDEHGQSHPSAAGGMLMIGVDRAEPVETWHMTLHVHLPDGFEPVAVGVRKVGWRVRGPWSFAING